MTPNVFIPLRYRNPIAVAIAEARPYERGCVLRNAADGSTSLHPAIRHPDGRVEVIGVSNEPWHAADPPPESSGDLPEDLPGDEFSRGDRVKWSHATLMQLPWWIRWVARRWRGTVVSVVDGDSVAGVLVVQADRGNDVEMPFATFEIDRPLRSR